MHALAQYALAQSTRCSRLSAAQVCSAMSMVCETAAVGASAAAPREAGRGTGNPASSEAAAASGAQPAPEAGVVEAPGPSSSESPSRSLKSGPQRVLARSRSPPADSRSPAGKLPPATREVAGSNRGGNPSHWQPSVACLPIGLCSGTRFRHDVDGALSLRGTAAPRTRSPALPWRDHCATCLKTAAAHKDCSFCRTVEDHKVCSA